LIIEGENVEFYKSDMTSSFPIAVIVVLFAISFYSCDSGKSDIDAIKEHAVGTWMGCTDMVNGSMDCLKIKISEDGTFTEYHSKNNSSTWGDPVHSGTWKIGTDKYPDTGNSYYYVELIALGSTKKYPVHKGQLLMDYRSASNPGPYLSKGF